VYADIPRDGFRSRGFGVVRYKSVEEAQKAVDLFNNYELNGRIINVREDKNPRPDFFGRSGGKPSNGTGNNTAGSERRGPGNGASPAKKPASSSDAQPGCQLFVGNLPWSVTWQSLKDLAHEKTGLTPVRADVAIGFNGQSRGWGTLLFASPEQANGAIGKNI
jgi:RNA recognition motif-containing protein